MPLKHIGRMVNNQRKVLVAYRVIPGASDHCLVIHTDQLDADQHDSVMRLVESNIGQDAYELAEAMSRVTLPDGRNMLAGLHYYGKLAKVPTNKVEMTPDTKSVVNLEDLNLMIAQQKGVSVDDLAVKPSTPQRANPVEEKQPAETRNVDTSVTISEPISSENLASQMREQAAVLLAEAKALQAKAEKLHPVKGKRTRVKTSKQETAA